MNCREIRERAPLYLSGEMHATGRQAFDAHLAGCATCEQELAQQAMLDERLASLGREAPDTTRVEHAVRRHISASQSRRRWLATGAVAATLLTATYGLLRLTAAPRLYLEAARDHQAEVVDRQPRRWRSAGLEIATLVEQHGLSLAQAAALAPAGYSLERAKNCGIDGQRMLHLVFSNGTRTYSVFVRADGSAPEGVRIVRGNSAQIAGFETGRFRALVVTAGSASECEELARVAAARL